MPAADASSALNTLNRQLAALLAGEIPPASPAPRDGDPALVELTDTCNRLTAHWIEFRGLAQALAEGRLEYDAPPHLRLLAPLKQLQSSLRHLTWQTQQIALGDLTQQVDFMGDFSRAFNAMVAGLAEARKNQKFMIDQLRASRDQLGVLLESISLVLVGLDSEHRVVRWNRVAEACFGIPAGVAVGQPFLEAGLPWKSGPEVQELQRTVLASRGGSLRDVPLLQDGREVYLDLTLNPVEPSAGAEPGAGRDLRLLLVGVDVTDRHLFEIAKRQDQKLEAIGHLASGVAHEINTPLQYIGTNLSFCLDGVESLLRSADEKSGGEAACISPDDLAYLRTNLPRALAESIEGVRQASSIVQALKAFARAEDGDARALTDLNAELENTLLIAGGEWKKVAEVSRQYDPDLPQVVCYPRRLFQAFFNILNNGIQAVTEAIAAGKYSRGRLTLVTARRNGGIEIRIADDGLGIPPEVQPHVFNPFFTTRAAAGGSGQGLYLARSIVVDRHQGTLRFETAPGAGTTFILSLPETPAPAEPPR